MDYNYLKKFLFILSRNSYRIVLFVFFFFVWVFSFSQNLQKKPGQLREEILYQQQEKKSGNIAPAKQKSTTTKTKKSQHAVPAVGTTVFKQADPTKNKQSTLIYIEKSNRLSYDKALNPNIRILTGDVCFRHGGALLYCDSAYFNDQANTFDAYSNVRIVQGDTLTVYGNFLNYNGNTQMAQVWENVKMVNRNTTLTTEILYYDRIADLAYYDTGGVLNDGNNTLTSMWGQYSPATKTALFKDNVKMKSPEAEMTTDTLKYNTDNSVADIVGNSLIVYKEDTDIYSQRGWYDTKEDRMMLLDRSFIEHSDGKTLVGDTIFYDKKRKFGEAFFNVELNDPKQKTTLLGNYLSYDEENQIGLATDSALLVDWSTRDSLFLNADTLLSLRDSLPTDSMGYNKVQAYKNVRFYRYDAQGMCDSLRYSSRDSVMYLRGDPVLWSDNNQVTGKEIDAYTKNQAIDHVVIKQSAIAVQHDSLTYYNQLSGKEIVAYLDSGEMKKVVVNGNAETIYFIKDDKTRDYIGVNKTISSYITAYFLNQKIDHIVLTTASSGSMYPLAEMTDDDLYMPYFYWYSKERPLTVDELFLRFEKVEIKKRPESSKKPVFPSGGGSSENKGSRGTSESSGSKSLRMQ